MSSFLQLNRLAYSAKSSPNISDHSIFPESRIQIRNSEKTKKLPSLSTVTKLTFFIMLRAHNFKSSTERFLHKIINTSLLKLYWQKPAN